MSSRRFPINLRRLALAAFLLAVPRLAPAQSFLTDASSAAKNVPEKLGSLPARSSPDWAKAAVVYQVYLRAFSDSGKFGALESRLDELKSLGINCIYLLPVQPSGEVKKKGNLGSPYSVRNYDGVALEYGTKDGLRSLVQAAHEAGLKVILDWVANHTAWDNPLVRAHPEWYLKDSSGAIRPPNRDWTDAAGLDYRSAELRSFMAGTMRRWVKDYDVDGFRCDVADLLPLDFWEEARREVDREKRGLFWLAEGDAPADHLRAFDATYDWNLYDTLIDIVKGKEGAAALVAAWKTDAAAYPQGALRLRFIENHDKVRSAEIFGKAAPACAVWFLTLDGIPLIYNGQEWGARKRPSLFEREPIEWKSLRSSGAGIHALYNKLLKFRQKHPCLAHGQRFWISSSDPGSVVCFASFYRDDGALAAINFSSRAFDGTLEVPEIFWTDQRKLRLKPLFKSEPLVPQDGRAARLKLPAWGYQIWELK